MQSVVERPSYLDELKRWKDKDLIKVVTGIRRCGKSTLFELFISYLKDTGIKDEQIIHINLEDADYNFKDYKELYDYIMKLFNISFVDPKIQKQIKKYIEENNYTYSGIKKALVYFFEIKGNSVEKANGGIGIVPYVYTQAYNYYYSLWLAQQKNEDKIVQEYIPKVKEIVIPIPEKNPRKRKLFSFLDDEEN